MLVCQAPALAGTPPSVALTETALRAGGLEVVAEGGGSRQSAKRSATDQAFGAWATTTDHPSGGDPTFFWHKGVERAVVARSSVSGGPRHLELCTLPNTCAKLPVKDKASGQEVTLDMDGASVAVTASGLLMAHNIGPTGSSSGDVYLATPVDATDLTKGWETTVVSSMALSGYKEDDPALSPDGLVIMFGGLNTAGDNDLWYSARATLTDAFPAPTQLSAVNSAKSDGNAYLAEVTIKGQAVLELYFTSDRDGTQKVYRSACAYAY